MAVLNRVLTILVFTSTICSCVYGNILNITEFKNKVNSSHDANSSRQSGYTNQVTTYYYRSAPGMGAGGIVAITAGVIVGLILIAGILACCIRGTHRIIPGRVISCQPGQFNTPQNQAQAYTQSNAFPSPNPYGQNVVSSVVSHTHDGSNIQMHPPSYGSSQISGHQKPDTVH